MARGRGRTTGCGAWNTGVATARRRAPAPRVAAWRPPPGSLDAGGESGAGPGCDSGGVSVVALAAVSGALPVAGCAGSPVAASWAGAGTPRPRRERVAFLGGELSGSPATGGPEAGSVAGVSVAVAPIAVSSVGVTSVRVDPTAARPLRLGVVVAAGVVVTAGVAAATDIGGTRVAGAEVDSSGVGSSASPTARFAARRPRLAFRAGRAGDLLGATAGSAAAWLTLEAGSGEVGSSAAASVPAGRLAARRRRGAGSRVDGAGSCGSERSCGWERSCGSVRSVGTGGLPFGSWTPPAADAQVGRRNSGTLGFGRRQAAGSLHAVSRVRAPRPPDRAPEGRRPRAPRRLRRTDGAGPGPAGSPPGANPTPAGQAHAVR